MVKRFLLVGKTILVTGASSGIGRCVAVACAEAGATIVLSGRNQSRLQATKDALEGEGHSILPADLTDSVQRQVLSEQVPLLDGVVHCAGIGSRVLGKMLEEDDVYNVMNANFDAPVLLQAKLLRNKKINKDASIVIIASAAASMPSVGNAIYSASKAALIAYAKCLALELAPRKIRVNCISPAMVWTDLILADGTDEEQLKEDEQKYPLKRYGQPDGFRPDHQHLRQGYGKDGRDP